MIRPFLFALQFLTCIPVAARGAPSVADLRWATAFYSLVGLLIGAGTVAVYKASAPFLPAPVSVVLVLLFIVVVTGALHEDGLADCVDGFAGAREPGRVLEIMRDSQIGAFGVVAVVFAVLLKFALLASLGERELVRGLLVAPVLSRWLVLPLAFVVPPARPDGLGSAFVSQVGAGQILVSAVPLLIVGGFLYEVSFVGIAAGPVGAVTLFGWYCRRRIGGITGDCLGAAIQFAEITTYLAAVTLEGSS